MDDAWVWAWVWVAAAVILGLVLLPWGRRHRRARPSRRRGGDGSPNWWTLHDTDGRRDSESGDSASGNDGGGGDGGGGGD